MKSDEYLVLLDENGKESNSNEFSNLLFKLSEQRRKIVFCVGGPHGSSDLLKERANLTLKLSSFILNHEVSDVNFDCILNLTCSLDC